MVLVAVVKREGTRARKFNGRVIGNDGGSGTEITRVLIRADRLPKRVGLTSVGLVVKRTGRWFIGARNIGDVRRARSNHFRPNRFFASSTVSRYTRPATSLDEFHYYPPIAAHEMNGRRGLNQRRGLYGRRVAESACVIVFVKRFHLRE